MNLNVLSFQEAVTKQGSSLLMCLPFIIITSCCSFFLYRILAVWKISKSLNSCIVIWISYLYCMFLLIEAYNTFFIFYVYRYYFITLFKSKNRLSLRDSSIKDIILMKIVLSNKLYALSDNKFYPVLAYFLFENPFHI